MTRKDYEMLAQALRQAKPVIDPLCYPLAYRVAEDQWREDVKMISNVLQAENSSFKKQRFLSACNY